MLTHSLIRTDYTIAGPYEGIHTVKQIVARNQAIVVMDNGECMGLLTAGDIVRHAHNLIADCISEKPFVSPKQPISDILHLMRQYDTHVLPVHDKEQFLGVVYHDDISEHFFRTIDEQKYTVQSIAHDLKSPITTIMGLTALLKEIANSPEHLELIAYTEQACEYATDIIGDLLHNPRLEEEHAGKELSIVDVNDLLTDCVNSIAIQAASKKLNVTSSISKHSFPFTVHPSKFKRAINNLLSNCIKFTPIGGSIGVTSQVADNSITISIKDNGIGIPTATQPFIFNRFTKARRSGTEGERSIGLGLYITKQIIELHSGTLTFESSEHSGTTFHISLINDNMLQKEVC